MELTELIAKLANEAPLVIFTLVLLNREMKKREDAECRERELLYQIAKISEPSHLPQ